MRHMQVEICAMIPPRQELEFAMKKSDRAENFQNSQRTPRSA